MSITNNYIEYWDNLIKKWTVTGEIPKSEQEWVRHFNEDLIDDLMPEPYWGNPEECSLAYIGYNPFGEKNGDREHQCHRSNIDNKMTICGLLSTKYSEIAKNFPQLEKYPACPFGCYEGTAWWKERNKWFKRFNNSDKKPFVMELCAWHSSNWKYIRNNQALLKYVQKNIIPVLKEAISNSELKIGLSVGKEIGDILLNLDKGKWKETIIDWATLYENHNITLKRKYRVLQSPEGYYMINTYNGRNRPPGEKFNDLEKDLIQLLKN